MAKNNLAVNQLLERKEIFGDLINGALFSGREFIDSEKLELKSVHSGIMQETEKSSIVAINTLKRIGKNWRKWIIQKVWRRLYSSLMNILLQKNQLDVLAKVVNDAVYREKLYREYQL